MVSELMSRMSLCLLYSPVRYRMQEETRCLRVMSLDPAQAPNHVALSPDGLVIAVAINTSVSLYSCNTGELIERLINIHNGPIFM